MGSTTRPVTPDDLQDGPNAAGQPNGEDDARTRVIAQNPATTTISRPSLASQYSVMEKIGDGGMGVVYLARDNLLGRFVAIKRLNSSAVANAMLRRRFLNEAKAVALLNHIHIVHVYALGEDEDGPYIVMEYVPGPPDLSPGRTPPTPLNLGDRVLRLGPLSLPDTVDLGLKLCRAVEYAHSCGIIHRDIKPSNVLLDESGEPKLVDFGLARHISSAFSHLTQPGEKMLSLGYGAPEQEQDASRTDQRADVYGLGGLIYFSFTGQNPRYFREADIAEPLRTPLAKALRTDREKRWQSVSEFRAALLLIRSPSTIDVPTAKTTWRCKWCDTVNPVAIPYCGECGWDGRETCAECGSEIRVGIQFCGGCGANTREYEGATRLLNGLRRLAEEKRHEEVIQKASGITGFLPVGAGGRKIIAAVEALAAEARKRIERRERLVRLIEKDMASEAYEEVLNHIREYGTLATDEPFKAKADVIPDLIHQRDLKAARQSLKDGTLERAERLCGELMRKRPADADANALSRRIQMERRRRKVIASAAAAVVVLLLYVLSVGPVWRTVGDGTASFVRTVYTPAVFLHRNGPFAPLLRAHARLWGAQIETGTANSPRTEPPRPDTPPPAGVAETAARIAELRRQFDADLSRAADVRRNRLTAWPSDYVAALKQLQQTFQQEGDFDGWTAVSEEIKRFSADLEISDGHMAIRFDRLIAVQALHRQAMENHTIEHSRRVLELARRYIANLESMQKEYTRRNRMHEAGVVNAEVKRVRTDAAIAEATQAVTSYENQRTAIHNPS
jgi:serine/threonine protein kinase